ncbi:WD40 repeat-like protein [Aureobasidium sp. EXF-10727]|nr:WD40 repeat-like protein [Aureobasidium sp. EXF-10727]KAI4724675.1 WD40 repeat-like protein [Aureobasidium sp. EXF-10728]
MVKRKSEDAQLSARATNGKNARFAEAAKPSKPAKKSASTKPTNASAKPIVATKDTKSESKSASVSIQVVTGSYERVLHGFAATVSEDALQSESPEEEQKEPTYSDTFLFAAHSSAVRCLALSAPNEAHKRVLATGSTDERINLFNLSTSPPLVSNRPQLPTLSATSVIENPRNKELGSLLHHARSVNKLQFPTRGKLFSAADDNTVAISRTRDWTVLSTIKCPIPKAVGRPSGDTAGPGEVPTGVNDFAIHPSMKVMVTVGKGERCMRLWNLVTGKKAGVLNFDKSLLQAAGEGRYSSGEGRKLAWGEDGEEYVVGFERGAVIYGMDSMPKAIIRPSPPTKLHQMRIVPAGEEHSILAVSTEDGRVIFYDLKTAIEGEEEDEDVPQCAALGQLGGNQAGFSGRIKDFEVLQHKAGAPLSIVTGSSDGAVRLWKCSLSEILEGAGAEGAKGAVRQVGTSIGTHETGHRITCLAAFVMDGPAEVADDDEDDAQDMAEGAGSDSDDE